MTIPVLLCCATQNDLDSNRKDVYITNQPVTENKAVTSGENGTNVLMDISAEIYLLPGFTIQL